MLVLMDTSIIMYLVGGPSSYLDDLEASLGRVELCVPDAVVRELGALAESPGAKGRKAKAALAFIGQMKVMGGAEEADDALVSVALRSGAVVGTLDRELISSLRRKNVAVATVRRNRLLLLGKSV